MKLKNIFAKATMIMLVIIFAISVFGSVVTMNQVNTPVLIAKASEPDYKLLYTVEQDGTATITGYEGMVNTLVIPSEIDGYPVLKIDVQAFATSGEELYNDENSYCSVETLIIEDGITEIELEAFLNCKNLKTVTLPNTLNYVWDMAFCGCDSLKEIKIPSGTGQICEAAFGYEYECNYIEGVYDYEAWTEKMDNFTIYGEVDSLAEIYANENGFTFISLDEQPTTTTATEPIVTTTTASTTIVSTDETKTESTTDTTTISGTVTTDGITTVVMTETETDSKPTTTETDTEQTTATTTITIETDTEPTTMLTTTDTTGNITTESSTVTAVTTTETDTTLPQTGYSKWYQVIAGLAACMTGIGGAMVIGCGKLKKKKR